MILYRVSVLVGFVLIVSTGYVLAQVPVHTITYVKGDSTADIITAYLSGALSACFVYYIIHLTKRGYHVYQQRRYSRDYLSIHSEERSIRSILNRLSSCSERTRSFIEAGNREGNKQLQFPSRQQPHIARRIERAGCDEPAVQDSPRHPRDSSLAALQRFYGLKKHVQQ
jgi:hypothetical protein